MYTLGFSHDLWLSSAALLKDGRIVAAVAEERLNGRKRYKGFPKLAIRKCLSMEGLRLEDVDQIAVGWNPLSHMESPHPRFSGTARWRPEYLYAVPNLLLQEVERFPHGPIRQKIGDFKAEILYVDHHLAHAACAYYLSPFKSAAVITADGRGERETSILGIATPGGIVKLDSVFYPHSLGLFYAAFTEFLGFSPESDQWKVMALGAYGRHVPRLYEKVRGLVEVDAKTGRFALDLDMFGYHQPDIYGGRYCAPQLADRLGIEPVTPPAGLKKRHYDLACALQAAYEDALWKMLRALHRQTGLKDVVLAGGCGMNSLANGKITRRSPFSRVYIPSCPDDSGIAPGAALWAYHEHGRRRKEIPRSTADLHNYWGPSYDGEAESTLQKYKIPYEKLADAPKTAAALIADGRLVGWFQGRMEFGQRALGNRSILADPRDATMKDKINAAVKYREAFRPFAPAILAKEAAAYFEMPKDDFVPYMEKVCSFRAAAKPLVPAVVHQDGTGRIQTVSRKSNPRFYRLIEEFERLTGVPIVLNTSFNLNGEPIVCEPKDAIRTFFSCGLDALIVGDCLVRK